MSYSSCYRCVLTVYNTYICIHTGFQERATAPIQRCTGLILISFVVLVLLWPNENDIRCMSHNWAALPAKGIETKGQKVNKMFRCFFQRHNSLDLSAFLKHLQQVFAKKCSGNMTTVSANFAL